LTWQCAAKVIVTIDLFSRFLFKLCDVGRVASKDCFKLLTFFNLLYVIQV